MAAPLAALVPGHMAVPVMKFVLVAMAVTVSVRIAVPMPIPMAVTVPVGRAGDLTHATIVRDELRFRTSTITRYAHMRNERNNMLYQEAIHPAAKRVTSTRLPCLPLLSRLPVAAACPRARDPRFPRPREYHGPHW